MQNTRTAISEATISELKSNPNVYPGEDGNPAPPGRNKPPFFHRGKGGLIEYLMAGSPCYLDLAYTAGLKDLHLQQDLSLVSLLPRLEGIPRFWIVEISGSGRVGSTKTFPTKNIPACPCSVSCPRSIPLPSRSCPFLSDVISKPWCRLVS
jgi:hypothetical protein